MVDHLFIIISVNIIMKTAFLKRIASRILKHPQYILVRQNDDSIDFVSTNNTAHVRQELMKMFKNIDVTKQTKKYISFTIKYKNVEVSINVWYPSNIELPTTLFWLNHDKDFLRRVKHHFKKNGHKINSHGLFKGSKRVIIESPKDIYILLNSQGFEQKTGSDHSPSADMNGGRLACFTSSADLEDDLDEDDLKKIVQLVYDNNEKSQHKLLGGMWPFEQLYTYATNVFSAVTKGVRKQAPPAFREFMVANGDLKIVSISACRTPVQQAVQSMISLISLGKWDEERHKYNYDTMYHVYLLMTVDNGRQVMIEKNSVLNIGWWNEDSRAAEAKACIDIPNPAQPIQLRQFFQNAVDKVGESIFLYDGANNNCQIFLRNLLTYNNLITIEFTDFIMQNTEQMVNSLPTITQATMKSVTDLAGIWDVVLHGEALKKKNTHKKHIHKKHIHKKYTGGCTSCENGKQLINEFKQFKH